MQAEKLRRDEQLSAILPDKYLQLAAGSCRYSLVALLNVFWGRLQQVQRSSLTSRLLSLAAFLEARIIPERIKHGIEPEQRGVNPSQHQKEKQSGGCFCRCRLSIMLRRKCLNLAA